MSENLSMNNVAGCTRIVVIIINTQRNEGYGGHRCRQRGQECEPIKSCCFCHDMILLQMQNVTHIADDAHHAETQQQGEDGG